MYVQLNRDTSCGVLDAAKVPNNPNPAKPVTIRTIADALGINKSTVSVAFSGKGRISPAQRERILSFAQEMGYEPDPLAQRLANRSQGRVVCLCSGSLDTGRGTEKIALLQSQLTALGMEVPFYTAANSKSSGEAHQSQISLLRQLRRQRPQAIICSVHAFQDEALAELEQYQQEGGILITYDLSIPLACDQVIFDRVDNAYQGARYLLEHGHRQIGLGFSRLAPSRSGNVNTIQNNRVSGFRKALEEWGEDVRREWIFENAGYERGGAQMARQFLELKERPTGVYIVNDHVALAFMVELMRVGVKVPDDISIIGTEDQLMAAYLPVPLTSVSQPIAEIVQATVDALMDRLQDGNRSPRIITVRGKLIERQSVAPLVSPPREFTVCEK